MCVCLDEDSEPLQKKMRLSSEEQDDLDAAEFSVVTLPSEKNTLYIISQTQCETCTFKEALFCFFGVSLSCSVFYRFVCMSEKGLKSKVPEHSDIIRRSYWLALQHIVRDRLRGGTCLSC